MAAIQEASGGATDAPGGTDAAGAATSASSTLAEELSAAKLRALQLECIIDAKDREIGILRGLQGQVGLHGPVRAGACHAPTRRVPCPCSG